MGSGNWFKTIIRLRKSKGGRSKKAKGTLAPEKLSVLKSNNYTGKESSGTNGIKSENLVSAKGSVETIAATRIQTAFRAYKVIMNLAKLIGDGAGRNAGSLRAHGKAVSPAYPLTRRKFKISSQARFRRIRAHQHLTHQFQSKLLPMQKEHLL